ncbi:sigma 54-interacting transcriptional regulator [bacterium]|nr:sigma 54-interacting transcriptional regulator [bacterium]
MNTSKDKKGKDTHLCRDVILDSIADGVFTVDLEWRITSFNHASELITGVPRDEAIGRPCCEVFRANICENDCALRRTMKTGRPVVNEPVSIIRSDGEQTPISVSTALLKDKKGDIIGGVETFRDLRQVMELRKELRHQYTMSDIISRNHAMQKLFAILPQVAQSESTVLIEGASGTGKELFAHAVHRLSPRSKNPFVIINCAALPDTLLESELFGYKAGAFTDAKKDKPGRFALAEGGTIFLDEIGDISQALQVRLLRVLQNGQYEPLGGTGTVKANVRVIAATNKSLKDEVSSGRFREDLYYRINVIRFFIPPLKERKEDIPLLVEHFIEHFNRLMGKNIMGVSDQAMAILMQYDWPGNVRELENALEHAFILCRQTLIMPEHLPEHLRHKGALEKISTGLKLNEIEAQAIMAALERNDWRTVATARELGIDKNTLRRKIIRFGIHKHDNHI